MNPVGAGELNRRIRIEKPESVIDDVGQSQRSWRLFASVWADIQPLSGREFEVAQSIAAGVNHLVTIRYLPGVTAAMRINYQGRFLNIESVMDVDTGHHTMQLACTEGLNDGR